MTKPKLRLLCVSIIVAHTFAPLLLSEQSEKANPSLWRAATYRGLRIGKSTRADMVRVLGNPLSSGPSADQTPPRPIIGNDYGLIKGELSGRLAVEVDIRNNRIVSVSISPDNMSREDAIRYFGKGYLIMGDEFCRDEPDAGGVGTVYESPTSRQIEYVEYRSRGIAIHIDSRGIVSGIYFVSAPIGLVSEKDCPRKKSESR